MKKMLLVSIVAALMGAPLVGCGSTADDETSSTQVSENLETEETADEEEEEEVAFDEQWYVKWYYYDEEADAYFEIREDDSGTISVVSFGTSVEDVYLTTAPDAYTEDEDGGYKYYDDGSNFNSVMVYYPETYTLVIMASENTTYTCEAVDTAYGIDPYGFANNETWWDVYSQRAHMDIRYATSKSMGTSYYEVSAEWSDGSTDTTMWEATGQYDAETNSIVFADARNYTIASYADGTEQENDIYTDAAGTIYMDCNQRLYWEDESDGLETCVFENDAIDYSGAYMEGAGIYGTYECGDGDDAVTADIWIGDEDNISFDIVTSDGGTETLTGSISYYSDTIYVSDIDGVCSLEIIFLDDGATIRVVVEYCEDEEYEDIGGFYTLIGESTHSTINWDEVS